MLPTSGGAIPRSLHRCRVGCCCSCTLRSEEHTSELQSRLHLVCRLLLEKKKKHATREICCGDGNYATPGKNVSGQPSHYQKYEDIGPKPCCGVIQASQRSSFVSAFVIVQ